MEANRRPRGDAARGDTTTPSFTALSAAASLTFELKACDPAALCGTDSVVIVVKAPPVVVPVPGDLTPIPTLPSLAPTNRAPATTLRSAKVVQRDVTFRFSSDEADSTFLCRLDRRAFVDCESPKAYKRLKPGMHIFRVKAVNAQGLTDSSPAIKKFRIKQ